MRQQTIDDAVKEFVVPVNQSYIGRPQYLGLLEACGIGDVRDDEHRVAHGLIVLRIVSTCSHVQRRASSVQEQPYYKLRVGAFRTKQEALTFISTLSGWPGAYPAKDPNIHPRDFLEQ